MNCALLGYYAVSSGNFLLTFRDNLSVPFPVFKNPEEIPSTESGGRFCSVKSPGSMVSASRVDATGLGEGVW